MRILVTGASGLVGLNLAIEAARQGHTVYGTVNRHTLRTEAFTVLESDLLAPGAVGRLIKEVHPDWVIHCAALANVDHCEAEPELARELNSKLPAELAKIVARGGARLVQISTDAVFDGQRGNYGEEDEPNPLSVYAQTKLEAEHAVAAEDPRAIIARIVPFGWSMSGRRSLGEFFFNNLQAGQPVNGFTDVIFCPMLVNYMATTLLEMLAKGLSGLYHVAGSECLSKYEFGVRLARRFGLDENLIAPVSVMEGGLTATRSPNLALRTGKLAHDLGSPPPDLDTSLEEFYNLQREGYQEMIKGLGTGD